jgi:hypothetical protein
MEIALSTNRVPIRLSDERWTHIVENHDDLAGRRDDVLEAVERPAWVTRGYGGARIAWRPMGRSGFLSVVYKETSQYDGFVITAFFTRRPRKKNKLWP